jgi:aryl-alcohol dehydrogenase-like predicted oxidoreductase
METRKLGNSDLQLTSVGFGAWAIGGGGWEFAWGSQEDTDSVAAILRALELGVNWIDTAAVYGTGHSEAIVAQALEQWKGKRPYIFTKCVLRWDENPKVFQDRRRFHSQGMRRQPWPPANRGYRSLSDALAAQGQRSRLGRSVARDE